MKKHALLLLLLLVFVFCGCSSDAVSLGEISVNEENGSNNIPLGGLSVLGDDIIYYVGEGENGGEILCAMGLEGENEAVLYTPESNLDQISCLNYDGTALYFIEKILDPEWLGVTEQRIRKYVLQSGEITTLALGGEITNCLTYHDGYLYYTEMGIGEDYALMRCSVDSGETEHLTDLYSTMFVIAADRIWCGFDPWSGMIVSYDLKGKDRCVHYENENGVGLELIHGDRMYFYEYAFEAPGQNYSMTLSGADMREFGNEIGGEFNAVGDTLYVKSEVRTTIATSGDLGVELPVEEIAGTLPATHSDLKIEGADNMRLIPGTVLISVYRIAENGDLELISQEEHENMSLNEEGLGSISGHWRFYSVGEANNGRTLYKVNLAE
ncbi:MAG: DUF5050 domain-containing protein [Firmicutes bacterium]|nr:DUF5050 domain-containing protein [Bacillota bacterium]